MPPRPRLSKKNQQERALTAGQTLNILREGCYNSGEDRFNWAANRVDIGQYIKGEFHQQ